MAQTPGQPLFPERASDDLSSYLHRQAIGASGLGLPILLWIIAGLRPLDQAVRWQLLNSVSAYYYSGAVVVFAGILSALAVFLFTYQGYDNAYRRRDVTAAIVAGVAAIFVAFFPTRAPEGLIPPWWTPRSETIHAVSAVVLFGSFAFFCLFLFPKTKTKKGNPLPRDKKVRNVIYYVCGAAMVICLVLVALLARAGWPIFWPEALALEFFAISWLVKGRADHTAMTAAKRTLYYGRHPGQLIRKTWRAMRGST